VVNGYSFYAKELQLLKDNGFKDLAAQSADVEYYKLLDSRLAVLDKQLALLKKNVVQKQKRNAEKIELLVQDTKIKTALSEMTNKLMSYRMPEKYTIPDDLEFTYIDTFDKLNDQQMKQAFFTSFVLPVAFYAEMNAYLTAAADGRKFTVGLNNDFTKDRYMLLGNAYVFENNSHTELRFNKYTHHPVGGHSMLLNPGNGNVFDEDSAVAMNLKLFTPPSAANNYPVQLSETNYTYAGDDDSGQGVWTIFDYLRVIAGKNHFLNFHIGLNNVDKPIINDYFNFGNRPYQVNALNLVAAVAWAKNRDALSLLPEDFSYNRFTNTLELKSKEFMGIGGTIRRGETLVLSKGGLSFSYHGLRDKTDCAIFAQRMSETELVIHFFGLERNNRQQNRESNPNLIQVVGQPPIVYEKISGVLTVYCGGTEIKKVIGVTPTGQSLDISPEAYSFAGGTLTLDTEKTDKTIISYRVQL
jgi:hypothetical protein